MLPKYEVKAELAKDWFLVDETITGHVTTKYSYGRAVEGELKVTASRYVGEWEEYATYTAHIDGEGDFTIEPAGYVAGVPEAGGLGNVRLDITVVEKATGYEQTTTELLTVAESPLNLQLIPESSAFKPDAALQRPGGDRDSRRRAGGGAGDRGHLLLRRGLQRSGARDPQGRDQRGARPGRAQASRPTPCA